MKSQISSGIIILLFSQAISCVFIKLDKGIIRGKILTTPIERKTFYSFQQIPYAAPPIGNLRFQPPQPVQAWKGILDTTEDTKICYQVTSDSDSETEDCLYLNVYTPKLPRRTGNRESLPVMVFIHGGGFVEGSGIYLSYGPEFFINYDVLIVTLNYRLGPFGFVSTQDGILPGNNGLKDQLFALQWVNRYIHLFGGDSNKITLFGQSSGAASVGYHLISRKSRGLFRAAIMESSTALSPFGYQRDERHYTFQTAQYINPTIDEDTTTSEEILDILLNASASEIDQASVNVSSQQNYYNIQTFQGFYYAPVIESESEDAFLTEKMYEVFAAGEASKVPVIVGINSEEGVSPTTDLVFLSQIMAVSEADIKSLVPNDMNVVIDPAIVGQRIRELYVGNGLLQNDSAASIIFWSDRAFNKAVIEFAVLQSQYSDVHFYQFSYDGLMGNNSVVVKGTERVGHNEELGYMWRSNTGLFYNYDLSIFPQSDLLTSQRLLNLWTTFAKTLNPTPEGIELLQNVVWPKVSSWDDFPYLDIRENLEIRYQPKAYTFRGWTEIYNEFGNRPYDTY